ncbi:hypothetical protein B0J11DRAFT_547749 [Dendryphion nanum]|uniref:Uncharacterized protein n=1 Tax=Dendryphion nanum TaxID=256645 RepID=A0A9P9EF45_9PLEO|nr:hypothetical protein B0J11DRAFT_547749 [Dendryphion nanum]
MPRQSLYRPAKPLSYELSDHSKAYIEANEYASGYSFLNTLLTSGTSISTPAKPYFAHLPPPSQISLASTLVVLPSITTRALSDDDIKGSDAALNYLRTVQNTISPLDSSLRTAFTFSDERKRRRFGVSHNVDDETEKISIPSADSQSLWCRASDFWHVVGWAFNCSVAHKKRWARWKLWLELMLDLLESEWDACTKKARDEDADMEGVLMGSIVWHYVSSMNTKSVAHRRRMVRAILAMATPRSLKDFGEVWKDETRAPKAKEDVAPMGKIDIDNLKQTYFQRDEEDEVMEDVPSISTRSSRSRNPMKQSGTDVEEGGDHDEKFVVHSVQEAIERLGGTDAITMRQRLIALLVDVAQALPTHFMTLAEIFNTLTEDFINLPTMIFAVLVSTSKLAGIVQMALNANLLLPLTPGELPDYTIITPEQTHLEEYLLPRRANTQSFAANAKFSLILEQMFIYMMSTKSLKACESLRFPVETGIKKRHEVHGTARGRNNNAHEEVQAKSLMEASSARLLGLLEVLEIAAGIPSQPKQPSMLLSFTSVVSDELSSPPDSDTEEQ